MQLELLALVLADTDTAVAYVGVKPPDEKPRNLFEVALPYAEVTTERVLDIVSDLQAKMDTLKAISEACQPKVVVASGLVVPFGKPTLVN
jgi:hypothetical protein